MNVRDGLVAGFVATVVLSLLMTAKHAMGLMPALDPVAMLAGMVARMTGTAPNPLVGWVMHFFIGTVMWGVAYTMLEPRLPGSAALRGMLFVLGPWFLMMIVVMPMAGAGVFGLGLGTLTPIATLALHLVFGATLGIVYGKARGGAARADILPA